MLNAWHEERNLKTQEIAILRDFHYNLKSDIERFDSYVATNNVVKNSIDILIEHFHNDLPYHDSLAYHFAATNLFWTSNLDESIFKTLQSLGVNLISNNELRQKIIGLYGVSSRKENLLVYRSIIIDASKNIYPSRFDQLWKSNVEDFVRESSNTLTINPLELERAMIPPNYETLKKDSEYLYFLKSLKNQNF